MNIERYLMAGEHEENIFLISDFDDDLEKLIVPLTRQIQKQAGQANGAINIIINSYGGYVHTAITIVELIELAKSLGIIVRTIVPAAALSCGSYVAITGTVGERYIGKLGEHLVHHGQIGSFESTPKQIERFTAWKDRFFKSGIKHYQKYCNIPDLEMQLMDDGFFVTAPNAIKWGLADKYMDKLSLGPFIP